VREHFRVGPNGRWIGWSRERKTRYELYTVYRVPCTVPCTVKKNCVFRASAQAPPLLNETGIRACSGSRNCTYTSLASSPVRHRSGIVPSSLSIIIRLCAKSRRWAPNRLGLTRPALLYHCCTLYRVPYIPCSVKEKKRKKRVFGASADCPSLNET